MYQNLTLTLFQDVDKHRLSGKSLENLIDQAGNFSSSFQSIGLVFSQNDNGHIAAKTTFRVNSDKRSTKYRSSQSSFVD